MHAPDSPADDRRSARAHSQAERILRAAETCFTRRGFHATSISEIAGEADISAGLIYRYFDNKAAIVGAIIERQLIDAEHLMQDIRSADDIVQVALHAFDRWSQRIDGAPIASLSLDLGSEAGRDPGIADAASRIDAWARGCFEAVLQRADPQADPAELRGRALMLQCLIEGLAVRIAREPALERSEVERALARAIPALMTPP